MKQRSFESVLLPGHKQDAVGLPFGVPFDRAAEWGSRAESIGSGHRGHRVPGRFDAAEAP